jgi:hypothetical protein
MVKGAQALSELVFSSAMASGYTVTVADMLLVHPLELVTVSSMV